MYPAPFDYRRPQSVEEAVADLEVNGARVLAGGHSLLSSLKQRTTAAETLVDVSELDAIVGVRATDEAIEIGAATTYAAVLNEESVIEAVPMLGDAVSAIGDPQIRNRGTVGGNLIQADPGADLPAVALAGDVAIDLVGPTGDRTITIDRLYAADAVESERGERRVTSAPDELVTDVRFPKPAGVSEAYCRQTHPATGYATIGVAARLGIDDDVIISSRIAASGLTRLPVGLNGVETAIEQQPIDTAPAVAGSHAGGQLDAGCIRSDPNVSASYRRRLLAVVTEEAVTKAIERATGEDSP